MIFLVTEYDSDVKFTPITPSEFPHFAQDTPFTTGQFIGVYTDINYTSSLIPGRQSFV